MDPSFYKDLLIQHYKLFAHKSAGIDQLIDAENALDLKFGIIHSTISLAHNHNYYSGLNHEALNSSYIDLMRFMQNFPSDKILDVGAGHARLGFIIAILYPHIDYYASEIVSERISALEQFKHNFDLPNIHIFCGDFFKDDNLHLVKDVYLYLPWEMISQLLSKLMLMKKSMNFWVVESHDDVIKQLDSRVYFKRLSTLDLIFPRHHDQLVCYEFDYDRWMQIDIELCHILNSNTDMISLKMLEKYTLSDHSLSNYYLQQGRFLYTTFGVQKDLHHYYLPVINRYFFQHEELYLRHKANLNISNKWLEKLDNQAILRIDLDDMKAEVSANNWNQMD
jgi:hypothetical protein